MHPKEGQRLAEAGVKHSELLSIVDEQIDVLDPAVPKSQHEYGSTTERPTEWLADGCRYLIGEAHRDREQFFPRFFTTHGASGDEDSIRTPQGL